MLRNTIGTILKKISVFLQSQKTSRDLHHAEMSESKALIREREIALSKIAADELNGDSLLIDKLLALHPDISLAVDIGSGAGWASAALSQRVHRVIAIEPSSAGIELSRNIFPKEEFPTIEWTRGFAENILPTLKLGAPAVFFTGTVLSHLRDKEVSKICNAIVQTAPSGSVLSFDECWGDTPWHQMMWHVRTKEWWRQQFPGWTLDFHGPIVPEKDVHKGIYHKGFWGTKR